MSKYAILLMFINYVCIESDMGYNCTNKIKKWEFKTIYQDNTIYPVLLNKIDCGWIDPDTTDNTKNTVSYVDGRNYHLVFSDEFNVNGRSFEDGKDPRWTSVDKNDYTNYALHYYKSNLATTQGGYLNITTNNEDISFHIIDEKTRKSKLMKKNYKSAMINGWNKFCFTGGIVEISAKLPGKEDISGLWPAMWLLGNLARATYVGSSDYMWPWSYDTCKRSLQYSQAISACNEVNHYDMHPRQGRGAPEIDILEAMPGKEDLPNTKIGKPYFSASFQVSPGRLENRPEVAQVPDLNYWYNHGIEYGENTSLNIFFYGLRLEHQQKEKCYQADAVSANSMLQKTHFEDFHKYRLEWMPGEDGYIKWFLDDNFIYAIHGSALNLTGAIIPEEPMYLLLNTAVSSTWGFPAPCPASCPCDCFDSKNIACQCAIPARMAENLPAHYLVDYVRVYQADGDENQVVGCSTRTHPTKKYIQGHQKAYMSETDTVPLHPVVRGTARCTRDDTCGYGVCKGKRCSCQEGYTGPHCMAAEGFDDIDWDPDTPNIFVTRLFVPDLLIALVVISVIALVVVISYKYFYERTRRGRWRLQSMGQFNGIVMNNTPSVVATYERIN